MDINHATFNMNIINRDNVLCPKQAVKMMTYSTYTLSHRPYRNNEAPLLEVFDQRNGVLFEVGQAAVDGLGVIVRSSLLLGPFVQPLLQMVVGAGQEHHQVRSADLPGERRRVRPLTLTFIHM